MKLNKIILLLSTICLTSCGNQGSKTTISWEMSNEAQAYYEMYEKNPDKTFRPGAKFNACLNLISSRSSAPQVMSKDIVTKNIPTLSQVNNENIYTFSKTSYENIVLYIHGGAYVFEATPVHYQYCDGLVDALNAKVVMPLYPLAPQHTFEDAHNMINTIYSELLKENKPIYVMGDSAGGGFSLALAEYCVIHNIKLPTKLILISPWIDITLVNPDVKEYEKRDTNLAAFGAQICGKLWAGTTDTQDYRVSPIYGDLSKLPDMMIFTCDCEIVCPDILKLYNECCNCNVTLIMGKGYFHVYPIYDIPERQKSYNLIKEFIAK